MDLKNVGIIKKDDEGKRCDKIFRRLFCDIPLGTIYKEIRNGNLRINGKKIKQDSKVSEGDSIDVSPFLAGSIKPCDEKKNDEKIDKKSFAGRIIFEDDDLLVLNKKKGELVHYDGKTKNFFTLDNLVRLYLRDKLPPSISFSPGPLHRLDRNTSGIIFFGKTAKGARGFSALLQKRKIKKIYIALFDGIIKSEITWKDKITRDSVKNISKVSAERANEEEKAETKAVPLFSSNGKTLSEVEIKTGKTHQIRAQGSFHGHPLTGDIKYRGSKNPDGYFLHALGISIEGRTFISKPDDRFIKGTATLMKCGKEQIKAAVGKIISSLK